MWCSRRHYLQASSFSLGGLGLAQLLQQEGLLAAESSLDKPELETPTFDLALRQPHFAPKATSMISMFMVGGPSQVDLFDPKPELVRLNGQNLPVDVKYDNAAQASAKVQAPLWAYKKYGQCGMEMSELLPHLGSIADEITLIRSMHTGVNNHIPSMYALNSGQGVAGRPSFGSWVLYALGSETNNLPSYVALTDEHGGPLVNSENWSNGWLPSIYQGTAVRPKEPRILNLDPPGHLVGAPQMAQLDLLRKLNQRHAEARPGESDLAARIANYELAARMQLAAKDAFDLSQETAETQKMYGIDRPETRDYGQRCLIARRLVERGVRYVQIFAAGQEWDSHEKIYTTLPALCEGIDQPSTALVKDLKARGMLDSTLVHWGGEMGRLPVIQNDNGKENLGRDHNTYGFSVWMAGGGLKAGHVHGATDEFSHHAIEDVVTHVDWLTTLAHQFGLDVTKLVFKRSGRELSLLDGQKGNVLSKLLA